MAIESEQNKNLAQDAVLRLFNKNIIEESESNDSREIYLATDAVLSAAEGEHRDFFDTD